MKRREGLYPAAIGQVTIQAGRLFRVELPFPSRLPEGVYEVRTYLLRDGKIVAAVSRPLPVARWGSAPSSPAGRTMRARFTVWAPSFWR